MRESSDVGYQMGSPNILVREIYKEDIRDIIEIIKKSKRDFPWGLYYNVKKFDEDLMWEIIGGIEDYPTLVAEYEGKVIAFATNDIHWEEEDNFYIELLLTHPNYRGLGAGTSLIKECIRRAVDKGFNVVSLHTWANNRAMRLYERTGFCWIPSTYVYMVNFSPQLMKYDEIKQIFRDAENLIETLVEPPRKMDINGHVAWRYLWRINGREVEAIFDNNTKKLLCIRIDDRLIRISPPEKKRYLKGERIKVVIENTLDTTALIDNKQYILPKGQHEFNIEARDKVTLRINNYEFGFSLEVVNKIALKILPPKAISNKLFIMIINYSNEKVKRELLILPMQDSLSFHPNKLYVEVPPRSSAKVSVHVIGEGYGKVLFGDVEEDFHVLKEDWLRVHDKGLESAHWAITKNEIRIKRLKNAEIWYEIYLGRKRTRLKFNAQRKVFMDKLDKALIEVRPSLKREELLLEVHGKALRDINEQLIIRFWIDLPVGENYYLIPKDHETFIREKYVYPIFPPAFCIVKEKLPIPVIGFEHNGTVLLTEYEEGGLYTMVRSPRAFRLDFPLKLEKGEEFVQRVVLKLVPVEALREFKLVRAVDTYLDEDRLIIRNNWVSDLPIVAEVNGIKLEKILSPSDEAGIPLKVRGYGVVNVVINVNGWVDKRVIKYIIPVKARWEDLKTSYGPLSLEADKRGGSLKSLKIMRTEMLKWEDRTFRTPTEFPITYGGIALNIMEGSKSFDLHLKEWEYLGNGRFRLTTNDLIVERRYYIIDQHTILDEIIVKNTRMDRRELYFIHCVFLNETFSRIGNTSIEVKRNDIMVVSHKERVWGVTKNIKVEAELLVDAEDESITASQQIGFPGLIVSRWDWILEPREEKMAKVIIRVARE